MTESDTPCNGHQLEIQRKPQFPVTAVYLGERLELRNLTLGRTIAARPLTLELPDHGLVILFRYGAAVFFDIREQTTVPLIQQLTPHLEQPYSHPETESVMVRIDPESNERLEAGTITLRDAGIHKLQTLASVLGKTVVLAQYEADIAANFDRIEPFALQLNRYGRGGGNMRELLRHIGRTLLDEQKLLGRVEVADKPELLWDHPELESLYNRLEAEYELVERAAMLDRKLALIDRTVRTVLELQENKRILRVEWYIVILIVFEIVLSLYEKFFQGAS